MILRVLYFTNFDTYTVNNNKKLFTGEPNKSAIAIALNTAYLAFSSYPHHRCLLHLLVSSCHPFSLHSSPFCDLIFLKIVQLDTNPASPSVPHIQDDDLFTNQ